MPRNISRNMNEKIISDLSDDLRAMKWWVGDTDFNTNNAAPKKFSRRNKKQMIELEKFDRDFLLLILCFKFTRDSFIIQFNPITFFSNLVNPKFVQTLT